MVDEKDSQKKRALVAWISSSVMFTIMVVAGVYFSDAIRTSNGDRPPVLALVVVSLIVSWLLRRYFSQYYGPKK